MGQKVSTLRRKPTRHKTRNRKGRKENGGRGRRQRKGKLFLRNSKGDREAFASGLEVSSTSRSVSSNGLASSSLRSDSSSSSSQTDSFEDSESLSDTDCDGFEIFDMWHYLPTELRHKVLLHLSLVDTCNFALVSKDCASLVNSNQLWKELCLRDLASEDVIKAVPRFARMLRKKKSKRRSKAKTQLPLKEKGDNTSRRSQFDRLVWKDVYRLWMNRILIIYIVYETFEDIFDVREKLEDQELIVETTHYTTKTSEIRPATDWLKSVEDRMKDYTTVLFFTNDESSVSMAEGLRNSIGNLLADFVESGNSVVIATFANGQESEAPGGRWAKNNYNPILPKAQDAVVTAMGEILIPGHPLLRSVTGIKADFKGIGEAHPDAKVIAKYDDGNILAAELEVGNQGGMVLSVNVFPLSNDTDLTGGWDNEPGNDVARLFANACWYGNKHKHMREWSRLEDRHLGL